MPQLLRTLNMLLTEVSAGLGASRSDFEQILDDLATFAASLKAGRPRRSTG